MDKFAAMVSWQPVWLFPAKPLPNVQTGWTSPTSPPYPDTFHPNTVLPATNNINRSWTVEEWPLLALIKIAIVDEDILIVKRVALPIRTRLAPGLEENL